MTLESWIVLSIITFLAAKILLFFYHDHKYKNAQKLLLLAKQEVRDIAQLPLNNPHPLIQINKNESVIFANPSAIRIFPGIGSNNAIHPILLGASQIETREVSYTGKVYHQTVMPASQNGEDGYIVYCYDITVQKQYEQKLKKSFEETEAARVAAEKAKEARGEFLANMSHELRTPMNGIIGITDILMNMDIKKEEQELIEAVNHSSRNLLILLNDILDFSKIEAGELTVENIAFDLRKIVQQIIFLQKPVASQKGLILKSHIAEHVPLRIIGDPSRIQQILNNLISNALKFTDEGAVTISIDSKNTNDHFLLTFSVSDTGIGIPESQQKKIFEKFQQADTSTSRKYGGTGLGLSITKDLSELMGGTITVHSEERVGSIFTLTLPAVAAADQETKSDQDTVSPNIVWNKNARLLVVDDHPINLLFMRKTLENFGFKKFDEAKNGQEALELLRQKTYDLILMDCQMPDMDGFEATKKIRSLESTNDKTVIIAVTANVMEDAVKKCLQAGMDDYISKPVDKLQLLEVLQQWLPHDSQNESVGGSQTQETTPSYSVDTNQTFDWSHLEEFTEGDMEMRNEIMHLFLQNLDSDIDHLKKSYVLHNYKEWDQWVHKIYGSCSNVGAFAMADICERGQSLKEDAVEDIQYIHNALLEEYNKISKEVKSTFLEMTRHVI